MNTKRRKKQSWDSPKKMFKIFFLCIFLLYIKLAYLSLSPVVYGENIEKFASTRNTVRKTITASRGTIFDKNKNILAVNVSSYTLIAYLDEKRSENSSKQNHVSDVDKTSEELAQVLGVETSYIKNILSSGIEKGKYQVEFGTVGRGITELKKDEIEALNLPGIAFTESQKRYYPNGNFASYVLGYAKDNIVEQEDGTSSTEITGELGIEAKYNDILKGTDGYLEYQQDRYGYKISGTNEKNIAAENGYDIYLTLDSSIQRFIETEVEEIKTNNDPEWLVLTAMDATTGEILGASSSPSFDPNIRNIENYENPFATRTYEPGSTMKIYTYMCAMETGNYDGTSLYDSGNIKIGDNTVNDWNVKGWGKITLDKGFEYSSNVGVVNLIKMYLSKEQLKDCLKKYGFAAKTGIEFGSENSGALNFRYEIELMTAGFGQGIETTVVQQLQAATIIANNGKMVKPRIVDKIINTNTNETYYESKKEISEQLVKKSTIESIKELMYNTVHGTDSGTAAKTYNIDGYDLIGKTGTAQIYESGKGYLTGDNNYIFSAIIMFPKDNPQYIIYGAMKKPKSGKSAPLSTAIKNLVKNISKYKNVYDETTTNKSTITSLNINSYIGKEINTIKKDLESYKLDIIVIGDGNKIINQYPSKNTTLITSDKLILVTNSKTYTMPNIIGWSRSDALTLSNLIGFQLTTNGYGFVKTQSIEAGKQIDKTSKLEIELEPSIGSEE